MSFEGRFATDRSRKVQDASLAGVIERQRAGAGGLTHLALMDLASGAHQAGLATVEDVALAEIPKAIQEMDLAVLRGIAAFLHSATELRSGAARRADELAAQLAAAPRHAWIVGRWLASLTAEGLATVDGQGRFRMPQPIRRAQLVAARTAIEQAPRRLGYPSALARYLLDSLHHLPGLLRDEVSAQALLFPDGDVTLAEAAYRDNTINRYLNAAAATAVRSLAAGRTGLRVVELGAGVGATTADLLPALAGRVAEYLFTDVSPYFLEQARARFGAHGFLRYRLLDFNAGVRQQLPDPGPVDLVVAVNAAHNAHHVGELLDELRALLSPGGALLLVETTREHHQSLASMPFLLSPRPGQPSTPRRDVRAGGWRIYLTEAQWRDALRGAGAKSIVELPEPGCPLVAFSQYLFLATFDQEGDADDGADGSTQRVGRPRPDLGGTARP